uniref:Uncharacterized protein n=1 Tax=Romanomermis culicivorax TaxID=13658 RepID=A0A915JSN8_ROMCU
MRKEGPTRVYRACQSLSASNVASIVWVLSKCLKKAVQSSPMA